MIATFFRPSLRGFSTVFWLSVGVFCTTPLTSHARETEIMSLQAGTTSTTSNGVEGNYRLININPNLGIWYLLERDYLGESQTVHLEVPNGTATKLRLERQSLVVEGTKDHSRCSLEGERNPLFIRSTQAFTASCSRELVVRHSTGGYSSSGELIENYSNQWDWSRRVYYTLKTRYLNRPDAMNSSSASTAGNEAFAKPDFSVGFFVPNSAKVKPEVQGQSLPLDEFGIRVANKAPLMNGGWLAVQDSTGKTLPAVSLSMITADASNLPIKIPESEKPNLVYLLAFDLSQVEIDYHLGGSQPQFGWPKDSEQTNPRLGPDGINSIAPLKRNGIVPFWQVRNLLAVFTGGMDRRENSAQSSAFAEINATNNSPRLYGGVIQSGVTLSRLNPGFATFYGFADGRVGIKKWQESDKATIAPNLLFARQNGFMIVENGAVGPLVWKRAGNWNGNDLWPQTQVRGGICIQKSMGREYLIYGLFSGATPVTMARVFLAYGCDQAMQLDIGSYATSFAEIFTWNDQGGEAQSLSSRTQKYSDQKRFIGESDHRDFFTVSLK